MNPKSKGIFFTVTEQEKKTIQKNAAACGINCSKTRACEEMSAVKQRFDKRGKVVAFFVENRLSFSFWGIVCLIGR